MLGFGTLFRLRSLRSLDIMVAVCVAIGFQNCSGGSLVTNPVRFKAKLSFSKFSASADNVRLCLTNIRLRISNFEEIDGFNFNSVQLPTDPSKGGFDVSYLYYDPSTQRHFVNGLFLNRLITLSPAGTPIADLVLPKGIYDQINFGFSKCSVDGVAYPSLAYQNSGVQLEDPNKFFVLSYNQTLDFDTEANNIFDIQQFMTNLSTADTVGELNAVLLPLRTFDLLGLSNNRILSLENMRFDQVVAHKDGTIVAGYSNIRNGEIWLSRFTSEGLIDESFAPDSVTPGVRIINNVITSEKSFSSVAVDSQNNIFVMVHSKKIPYNNANVIVPNNSHHALVFKFNEGGVLDTRFGRRGWRSFRSSDQNFICNYIDESRAVEFRGSSLLYKPDTNSMYGLIASQACQILVFKFDPVTGMSDINPAFQLGQIVDPWSKDIFWDIFDDVTQTARYPTNATYGVGYPIANYLPDYPLLVINKTNGFPVFPVDTASGLRIFPKDIYGQEIYSKDSFGNPIYPINPRTGLPAFPLSLAQLPATPVVAIDPFTGIPYPFCNQTACSPGFGNPEAGGVAQKDGFVLYNLGAGARFTNQAQLVSAPENKLLIAVTNNDDWMILRSSAINGSLDLNFNGTGYKIFTELSPGSEKNFIGGATVDSQGRILVAGSIDALGDQSNYDFGVTRLLANGNTDLSFAVNGVLKYNFNFGHDFVQNIMHLPVSNRIVVSGIMTGLDHRHYSLLVLNGTSGIPDQTISITGARVFFSNLDAGGGGLTGKNPEGYSIGGARNNEIHLLNLAK